MKYQVQQVNKINNSLYSTMKPLILEDYQFVTCEISSNQEQTEFTGKLTYKGSVNGAVSGGSVEAVRDQYHNICSLLDNEGGMLREGTIMLGYHNNINKGDVLLLDGEVIGRWEMEEHDDWSHFFPQGQTEPALTSPSAWLLHDKITNWVNDGADAGENDI